jgi:hypothetical protein
MIGWLAAHGLWQAVIYSTCGALIGGTVARVFAARPLRRLEQLIAAHLTHAARTADRLDTTTPGGLSDLLQALNQEQPRE